MKLRRWQQKVIDEFPEITKNYKKFILKAPTGAGKTVLASEIINKFYKTKNSCSLSQISFIRTIRKRVIYRHKVQKTWSIRRGDSI